MAENTGKLSHPNLNIVGFVEALPRGNYYKFDWDKISNELKSNPGKWAVIESEKTSGTRAAAQSTARAVRNGIIKGMGGDQFEATTRNNVVYARYVGEKGEFK